MMRPNRRLPSQRVAKRASRTPCERQFSCPHGVCAACESRAVSVADGRFDRVIVYGFTNRAQ
eukprot:5766320-Lingulodinium_polyedra.AAC.1